MTTFRPHEYPLDRCVTGPHTIVDDEGISRLVWRCGLCETESTDSRLREGCWNCDSEVGWR